MNPLRPKQSVRHFLKLITLQEIIPSLVAEVFFEKAQVVIELGGGDVARGLRAKLLAQTDQFYSPG